MSRKCHNPWTRTHEGQIMKNKMSRQDFHNGGAACGQAEIRRIFEKLGRVTRAATQPEPETMMGGIAAHIKPW